MTDDEISRSKRKLRRAAWPIAKHRLGEEPGEAPIAPDVALAAMRVLAERAWRLTGAPLPDYGRDDMPGRMVRGKS